jgi:NAD(P)H-flavin reductase
VVIDVGSDVASAYAHPGQYVQVRVGGDDAKPGFFAIANAPGDGLVKEGKLQFLIKEGGGAADALIAAPLPSPVSVSPVQGKGFPLARVPPATAHTLLLFGTGSGVAPLRAAILSGALEPSKRRDVRFYYGTRSPASTAFAGEVDAWRAAGVRVIPVYSDDGDDYVQDVFAKEGGLADGAGTAALLCGQKEMCEAVKGLLAEQGVEADAVLLNF